MCGIAGFISRQNKENSIGILERMLTRIRHRGPDESGVYICDGFGMGSVRLSIQDIVSGGMPIQSQSGNLWIVFNGEVFNFIELRQELVGKGYVFKTTGDTEVIVNLYEEYGTDFLKKLNGQFAIAIWDRSRKELLLARDRVGIRPLYYSRMGSDFVFGSEIKAFMEFPDFHFKISQRAISQYFTFWTTIDNESIFEDIFEVAPGSYMKINKDGITSEPYWELPVNDDSAPANQKQLATVSEELDALLEDSVRLRLRADVPVAAYLSGGLDSTITTGYIHKLSKENLNTFSIGFEHDEFDESNYQLIASDYFDTRHTSVRIKNTDISDRFEQTIWHAEAPLLRTSPVPMLNLSGAVRDNNIKVVITGEGADELFGGYNIFKEAKIRHFWSKDPESRIRPLLLKRLYPYLPLFNEANTTALRMFFGYKLLETDSPIYSHLIRWNNTSRLKNYFSQDFKSESSSYDPVSHFLNILGDRLDASDYLGKASHIEIKLFLSGYLLSSQGDRVSMANSVEGRYPFLDHRIIEFAMGMPSDFKLKGLNEKYILKRMSRGRIPESILHRSKQAYRAPIDQIFFNDSHRESRFTELLSESRLKQFEMFDPQLVKKLIFKFQNGVRTTETERMGLIGILSAQVLNDLFIKRSKGDLDPSEIIKLNKTVID